MTILLFLLKVLAEPLSLVAVPQQTYLAVPSKEDTKMIMKIDCVRESNLAEMLHFFSQPKNRCWFTRKKFDGESGPQKPSDAILASPVRLISSSEAKEGPAEGSWLDVVLEVQTTHQQPCDASNDPIPASNVSTKTWEENERDITERGFDKFGHIKLPISVPVNVLGMLGEYIMEST